MNKLYKALCFTIISIMTLFSAGIVFGLATFWVNNVPLYRLIALGAAIVMPVGAIILILLTKNRNYAGRIALLALLFCLDVALIVYGNGRTWF